MSTTTLPSFVELMASLGLENKDPADERSLRGHSRSSSYSSSVSAFSQSSGPSQPQSDYEMDASPYIVVSHPHSTPGEHEQRRHRVRYSPYTPAISHVRRGSLPSISPGESQTQRPRALSSSPRPSSPLRGIAHRTSNMSLSARRDKKLSLDADLIANTPISTFLRLKSPQSSPISPTFHQQRTRRSNSPSLPVSIPTLPTFCFPQHIPARPAAAPELVCGSSDTDDEFASDSSARSVASRRSAGSTGRRRQRRTVRHSDPLSPVSERPLDLDTRNRRRIAPLA